MAENRRTDLLQGTLDMLILKTLGTTGSGGQHGYGLARRIRQVSDDVLQVEEGSLYPALHRLEKRGFIEADWRQSESNRRAKYYRLTARGRTHLKAETASWTRLSTAIEKVMNSHAAAALPGAGA